MRRKTGSRRLQKPPPVATVINSGTGMRNAAGVFSALRTIAGLVGNPAQNRDNAGWGGGRFWYGFAGGK